MGRTIDRMYQSAGLRQQRLQTKALRQLAAQPAPIAVPAGWYYAHGDPAWSVRYWDGQQWTAHFKP